MNYIQLTPGQIKLIRSCACSIHIPRRWYAPQTILGYGKTIEATVGMNYNLSHTIEAYERFFPQQAIGALQSLSLAGLGSSDEILSKLIHAHNRQQSIAREPAFHSNIFREFYFKTMNGMNNNTIGNKAKIVCKKSVLNKIK